MEMEDLSLKVRENVMDQEIEVEDIPQGILNMRSAQDKEARRVDRAEANLGKALRTTLDFHNRCSTLVAVKPGSQETQQELRRAGGTGEMEVVQEDERVAMEI